MADNLDAPTGAGSTELEQFGYRQELKRSLSFSDLVVYGLIFMVPIPPAAGRSGDRGAGERPAPTQRASDDPVEQA